MQADHQWVWFFILCWTVNFCLSSFFCVIMSRVIVCKAFGDHKIPQRTRLSESRQLKQIPIIVKIPSLQWGLWGAAFLQENHPPEGAFQILLISWLSPASILFLWDILIQVCSCAQISLFYNDTSHLRSGAPRCKVTLS